VDNPRESGENRSVFSTHRTCSDKQSDINKRKTNGRNREFGYCFKLLGCDKRTMKGKRERRLP